MTTIYATSKPINEMPPGQYQCKRCGISRAGVKSRETLLEDLKKARWYLDRHISNIERGRP